MPGFANCPFFLPDRCPQVCGQHRPWLPLPLAGGHALQFWPLPEGCILPVVAREMSCSPQQGPLLGLLGPTQGAHNTSKALPSLKLGASSPWGPVPNPIPLWTLASGRGEWRRLSQSLELASGSAVALLLELLPESQGQCPALEKGTGELSFDAPGPHPGKGPS